MRVLSDFGWFMWGLLAIFCIFFSYELMFTANGWPSIVGAVIGGLMVGIVMSLATRRLSHIDEAKYN